MDGVEYVIPSDDTLKAINILAGLWENLGKPDTPLSDPGKKLVTVIISVWEDLYPLEAKSWIEARKEHLASEMTIREQIKGHTGRSLASYPYPIYQMFKLFFPNFDSTQRKNCMELVRAFPIFKFVNKI